jgi:beta-lactamase regulating signal transducer with metallopeptidase domain
MAPFQYILSQLGYGLICSFWQMGLLWAIYKIITNFGTPTPAFKFSFAVFLSFSGAVWFFITVISGTPVNESLALNYLSQISNTTGLLQGLPALNFLLYTLGGIYLLSLAIAGLRGTKHYKFSSLVIQKQHPQKPPVTWRIFVSKYAKFFGIKSTVELKLSNFFSPATFGILKPVILLPVTCLTHLSSQQIEALLLHELMHIRRKDYLWFIMLHFAEATLYFNPFMRFFIRTARQESEHACDDMVIQFGYTPHSYAHALLLIAQADTLPSWGLYASGTNKNYLLERISRMLGRNNKQENYLFKNLQLISLSLICFGIFIITGRQKIVPTVLQKSNYTFQFPNSEFKSETSWQSSVLKARVAILAAGIGGNEHENINSSIRQPLTKNTLKKNLPETSNPTNVISPLNTTTLQDQIGLKENNTLILSTKWAEQRQDSATDFANLREGWKKLTILIEQLEFTGTLEEHEWEQLATLIAFYSEIKQQIYREAYIAQYGIIDASYPEISEENITENLLVIAFDEATGILAASVVPRSTLGVDLDLENLPDKEQKVIVLRKRLNTGHKIIRL